VTTSGREPVLVPEQDPQIRAGVVGWGEETAVHVGVAARLQAQQLAKPVRLRVLAGADPTLGHGGARQVDRRRRDDAERLPTGVVVNRRDSPERQPSHRFPSPPRAWRQLRVSAKPSCASSIVEVGPVVLARFLPLLFEHVFV
jgi:hypothetical protein